MDPSAGYEHRRLKERHVAGYVHHGNGGVHSMFLSGIMCYNELSHTLSCFYVGFTNVILGVNVIVVV